MPSQPPHRRPRRLAGLTPTALAIAILTLAAALIPSPAHSQSIGNTQCDPAIHDFFAKLVTPCGVGLTPNPRLRTPDEQTKAMLCSCNSPDLIPCSQAIDDNCVYAPPPGLSQPGVLWPLVRTTEQLNKECA
ncbi:hypothetical protein DFJ73DRAFT_329359 [Zopfochytrium polystomum]|nr:hypothetical protein DFJ73DRAFT_329359 [Zopfochytrium polystomum]